MDGNMRSIKRFLLLVAFFLATVPGTNEFSYAITGGQPDGNGHPYVGAVNDGEFFCSGAAISPWVFVTSAHCFPYSPDNPVVPVAVTFDSEPFSSGSPTYYFGFWIPHPDFCLECGPGLPRTDTNDVAVVVFLDPVNLPGYAQLPTQGLVDTLAMGTKVTIVGYGAQYFISGGGPRQPAFLLTRYFAPAGLIASNHTHSEEYIKLSANHAQGKGGTCFGDSGGPDLLEGEGTPTILGINSYVTNYNCAGVTYSNRIDTGSALGFIQQFLGP